MLSHCSRALPPLMTVVALILSGAAMPVASAQDASLREQLAVPKEMLPTKSPPPLKAPDTAGIKTIQPLTARLTFDIDDIVQRERLPSVISPIMIDADRQNRLSLEDVLSLAERRNLPYLRTRWVGRQYLGAFLGSVGGMNGFFVGQNVQNVGLVTRPDYSRGQVFNQNLPIERLRYGDYGVVLANGGQSLIPLIVNLFQWRAAAASVKTSQQEALFEATTNYFDLCKQISLLHVANIVVENAKGIVELNQGLVESGMGTRLQYLQARTQLAAFRQQLVSQQVRARTAAISLGVTLNLPLSEYLLPEARPLDKISLVDPSVGIDSLVAVALKSRPEITQRRNQVRQQLAQSMQALTPLIPTATYTVDRGSFFPNNGSGSTSGIQRSLQFGWQLNSLAVPVGPNLASGLASARAAEYELRNTELQVRSQVRTAYDTSLAAEANIEIARQAALDAQDQLRLAEQRLQAGIGINIDVIQAQSALTEALQNYVNAVYEYNIQQARLRRAIGGFTYKSVRAKLRYN